MERKLFLAVFLIWVQLIKNPV